MFGHNKAHKFECDNEMGMFYHHLNSLFCLSLTDRLQVGYFTLGL